MILRRVLGAVSIAALATVGAACGDDDGLDLGDVGLGGDVDDGADDFADAMNEATGASEGSGVLTFDGTEYPIESAICARADDDVDVGTVGANYRVFVSGDTSSPSLQILDPEGIQWFDGDPTDASFEPPVTFDGSTIALAEISWWNNQNDREVTASFVIECP